MSNARRNTCKLIEAAEDGIISWEEIARECLSAMSEAEVSDMTGFAEFFDEESDEEDSDEEDSDWLPEGFAEEEDGDDYSNG